MGNVIICFGEVLWDALPEGLFLGGAPLNVASHLHRLGEDVRFVSGVGGDRLGREVLRRLEGRGMRTDFVQVDPALPTGFVEVTLDADGIPAYVIEAPAAWDAIRPTDALRTAVAEAQAVVFGSLVQRQEVSRRTLQEACHTPATKVFDVNLRPPFIDREVVEASLHAADVIKLNIDELDEMRRWWGLPEGQEGAIESLAARFGHETVCVTHGGEGAVLWRQGRIWLHPGYRVAVQDTVGAGDAFLAGLLHGLLAGHDEANVLDFANRLGAYVASQRGATPAYRVEDVLNLQAMATTS